MHNETEQIHTIQLEEVTLMPNKQVHSRRTVEGNSMVEELRMGHMVS